MTERTAEEPPIEEKPAGGPTGGANDDERIDDGNGGGGDEGQGAEDELTKARREVLELRQKIQDQANQFDQTLREKGHLEEYRSRFGPLDKQPSTHEERQAEARLREIGEALQKAQILANNGDASAQVAVLGLQQQYQFQQEMRNELALAKLHPEEAQLVREYFATGDYKTIDAARKAVWGDVRAFEEAERRKAEAQGDKKGKKPDGEKPPGGDPPPVRTNLRPANRPGTGVQTMTPAAWGAARDAALGRGDLAEVKRLDDGYNNGSIQVI